MVAVQIWSRKTKRHSYKGSLGNDSLYYKWCRKTNWCFLGIKSWEATKCWQRERSRSHWCRYRDGQKSVSYCHCEYTSERCNILIESMELTIIDWNYLGAIDLRNSWCVTPSSHQNSCLKTFLIITFKLFRCHSKNALWCNISDRHSQNLAVIWLHYSVLLYGSRHHHHPLSITPFVLGAEQSVPIEESSRQADNHRQRKQVNVVGRERVRGETKHWGERKSEKDRKRDLSLFSLYPHRKTTMVSKGAAILAPSFTQVQ